MTRRTGNKWRTDRCGRCDEAHAGYSGKLDALGIEYVVCGVTGKRMNVYLAEKPEDVDMRFGREGAFGSVWVLDD